MFWLASRDGDENMKPIRAWRVSWCEDQPGVSVYYDPREEVLELRDLTEDEKAVRLDMPVSVSGLIGSDDFPNRSETQLDLQGDLPQSLFGGIDGA